MFRRGYRLLHSISFYSSVSVAALFSVTKDNVYSFLISQVAVCFSLLPPSSFFLLSTNTPSSWSPLLPSSPYRSSPLFPFLIHPPLRFSLSLPSSLLPSARFKDSVGSRLCSYSSGCVDIATVAVFYDADVVAGYTLSRLSGNLCFHL